MLEIWKECVKGVDIIPEEEKPLALRNGNIVPEPSTQARKGAREFADSSTISNSAMAWWSPLQGRRSTCQFARRASTIEPGGRWEKAADLFIVVGWFPGTLHEPIEVCLQVKDDNLSSNASQSTPESPRLAHYILIQKQCKASVFIGQVVKPYLLHLSRANMDSVVPKTAATACIQSRKPRR